MIPIVIIAIIFAWAIYGMHVLDLHKPALEVLSKPLAEWFAQPGNPVRALLWIGALALSLASWLSPVDTLFNQMLPDFISISIAVIVIDELVGYRNALQEKQRLVRQMASHSNDFALDALRQIREKGWHNSGLLNGQYFFRANLYKADFYQAQLMHGWFFEANLEEADFEEANLQAANLEQTKAMRANFQYANLRNANLKHSNLTGSNMKNADLSNARLNGATLDETFLHCICLEQATLCLAKLQSATLASANLKYVDLRYANMENANLRQACLLGANLNGANLMNVQYDSKTIFPVGFDPVAAGAMLVELPRASDNPHQQPK